MIKNNKIIELANILLKIIIVFLLIAIFALFFFQKIYENNEELVGYGIYTVVSESMVPKYNKYDLILVKKVDADTLKINDDIVYLGKNGEFNNKNITHRIVDIEKREGVKYFSTKGIANEIEDPEINEKQVIGKVIYKFCLLSLLSKIINSSKFYYVMIPLIFVMIFKTIDTVKKKT